MTNPFSLQGRVALVTGASRGLGAGMALGLAQAGAHVVLNGRNRELLQARQQEISAAGGQASIAPSTSASAPMPTPRSTPSRPQHGHLDILINNAAVRRAARLLRHQRRRLAHARWTRRSTPVSACRARPPPAWWRAAGAAS